MKIIKYLIAIAIISCNSQQSSIRRTGKEELNALSRILKDYPYANTYELNDSNVFIFLKARDEYHDSWVYYVKEMDSTIDVDFRVLPAFTKTGYDSYRTDSTHFAFYEGYRITLSKIYWNELLERSPIVSTGIKDTVYDMDQGFGTANYLFWYKSNLLVHHVDSKYSAMFEQLDTLLSNSMNKKIEYRRNNPNTKFKDGPLLPKGNLTE